jgi:hypothetical protein
MKIEYVVLADGAQAVGGKLYILGGGWSTFYAPAFPVPINIGLGVNVSYTSNEIGMTYTWGVTIADEAGIPIIPEMKGQVQIPQLLRLAQRARQSPAVCDADRSRSAAAWGLYSSSQPRTRQNSTRSSFVRLLV